MILRDLAVILGIIRSWQLPLALRLPNPLTTRRLVDCQSEVVPTRSTAGGSADYLLVLIIPGNNPPTLQRSSVWEQLQITSVLVIRGFGSLRARGSWWERLIPNIQLQISPDLLRSSL